MQAEINGLMMAKKNSAVLWTVDQHTNDIDVKAGRKTAQKNIGITKDTAHNPPTGKLIDYAVEHKFIKKVTLDSDNDLTAEFGQPTLSDITPVASENKNWSVGTNSSDGTIETQDLTLDTNTDVTTDGNGTTYVSSVAQASNGKVTYKTKTITAAAKASGQDPAVSGIVPLTDDLTDASGAISSSVLNGGLENYAVTPLGVVDALSSLDVSDSAVDHKYVSSVSESDGKISVSRKFLTLDSINPEEVHKGKTVGINATTGAIEPQDLGTVDILEGSDPTNRFVSSIDQASNGQISYTTQQLKVAASNSIGGIKIGYTEPSPNTDKQYAVKLDSEKAYVQVPWENTHYTSKNVICKSASGTDDTAVSTNETAYLNHVENGSVTDFHKIVGNGITVAYDKDDKKLTLTSNSGTVTSITAGNGLNGGTITSTGTISVKADGTSLTVGSNGIKVTDPVPPHTSTQSGKYLGVKNDGTTDWLTVPQEVFYAEYGTTTYQAVTDALTAGKLVYTKLAWEYYGDFYVPLTDKPVGSTYYFETVTNNSTAVTRLRIQLTSSDVWSYDTIGTDGVPVRTMPDDANKFLKVADSNGTLGWGFPNEIELIKNDTTQEAVVYTLINQAYTNGKTPVLYDQDHGVFYYYWLTRISSSSGVTQYQFSGTQVTTNARTSNTGYTVKRDINATPQYSIESTSCTLYKNRLYDNVVDTYEDGSPSQKAVHDALPESEYSAAYNGGVKSGLTLKKISASGLGVTTTSTNHDLLTLTSSEFEGTGGTTHFDKTYELLLHDNNTGYVYSDGNGLRKRTVATPKYVWIAGGDGTPLSTATGYRWTSDGEPTMTLGPGQVIKVTGGINVNGKVLASHSSYNLRVVFCTNSNSDQTGIGSTLVWFPGKEMHGSTTQLIGVNTSYTFAFAYKNRGTISQTVTCAITVYDVSSSGEIYNYLFNDWLFEVLPTSYAL